MSDTEFRFRYAVHTRFRDTDIGGHVHHSQALIYMEEARWAYWDRVAGRQGVESVDYIMAEVTIRYHERTLYPGVVEVAVRATSIGRTHFELEYRIQSEGGALLTSGRSVQVMYDYDRMRSMRVPDELRERIEAFEGRSLPIRRGS